MLLDRGQALQRFLRLALRQRGDLLVGVFGLVAAPARLEQRRGQFLHLARHARLRQRFRIDDFLALAEGLQRLLGFGDLFFQPHRLAGEESARLAVHLHARLEVRLDVDLGQRVGHRGGEFRVMRIEADAHQLAVAHQLLVDVALHRANHDSFDLFGRSRRATVVAEHALGQPLLVERRRLRARLVFGVRGEFELAHQSRRQFARFQNLQLRLVVLQRIGAEGAVDLLDRDDLGLACLHQDRGGGAIHRRQARRDECGEDAHRGHQREDAPLVAVDGAPVAHQVERLVLVLRVAQQGLERQLALGGDVHAVAGSLRRSSLPP